MKRRRINRHHLQVVDSVMAGNILGFSPDRWFLEFRRVRLGLKPGESIDVHPKQPTLPTALPAAPRH